MIVDLVRNDFGRVCAFGTVRVPEFVEVDSTQPFFRWFRLSAAASAKAATGSTCSGPVSPAAR